MTSAHTIPEPPAAEAAPCLVCGALEPAVLYRIARFCVLRCERCRQVYLWPLLSEEEVQELFASLYTTGEGSVPELRDYYGYCYEDEPGNPLVQLYERWLDAIERRRPPGRLLDIGCGTGLFMAVARRRGWKPQGVDECSEATAHAREHFGFEVREGEFSTVAFGDQAFEAVTMWDIVEHARDPVALLRTARAHLAADGVVGLSTPNQRSILDVVAGTLYRLTAGRVTRPLEKFYIEQHFLYFTPETLQAALQRAGLETLELRRELTDLRRLTLGPATRWVLETLFAAARWTGLENRLFAVAGLPEDPTGR